MTGGTMPIDIVDAQIHLGCGAAQPTLGAMDALGITAVLVDEFWGEWVSEDRTQITPGYRLPNGSWRAATPTAEQASILHPDRFSYVVRIDRRDPELASLMRVLASSPHARAVRLQPVWTLEEAAHFAGGGYDHVFELAGACGLPVFLFIPGYVELVARYASKFTEVNFVIDHCGMGFPGIPPDRPGDEARSALDPSYFDVVLRLAEYPNVALKWSHAQDRFGEHEYPYRSLRPLLRRAIDAFGANRLLWASDHTVIRGHTWSDLLHYLRDDPGLSAEEMQWILGGSARQILNWPTREP
jgi:predicted TIM-barrel fold metal-dependent hydrolase